MRSGFVFALLALLWLTPASAHAQANEGISRSAVDEAREHFQRGVEFYRDRDLDAAFAEFTRAYELAPNFRLLYNLGQVHVERHDYAMAFKLFRQYLDTGLGEIAPARREQVEREIESLRARISELRVSSNVDGASVLVNGLVVGKTPMTDAVLVNAGVVQVGLRKPGYVAEARNITVVGAEKRDLEIVLASDLTPASASLAASVPGPVRPDAGARVNRAPLWIALGSTVALAAGATVFGIVADHDNSRLDAQLNTYPLSGSVDDTRASVKREALITDILGGAAIVAAGVTVYFAVSSPGNANPTPARIGLRPLGAGLAVVSEF